MTAWRWLVDWKNLATLIGCVLVGLLTFTVVKAVESRDRALRLADAAVASERESRKDANARIAMLQRQIRSLSGQAERNATTIAALRRDVAALRRQIRQLGATPVAGDTDQSAPDDPSPQPPDQQSDDPPRRQRPDPPRRDPKPRDPRDPRDPPDEPEPPDPDVCVAGTCVDLPLIDRPSRGD